MGKDLIIVITASWFCMSVSAQNSEAVSELSGDKVYVGLDEMGSIDPAHSKYTWYHLTVLKIKGDSVYADQSPIGIYKKDTVYSESDGGFFYYRGLIHRDQGHIKIDLESYYCDYCVVRRATSKTVSKRIKQFAGNIVKGGLLLNRYLFRPETNDRCLISERPPA